MLKIVAVEKEGIAAELGLEPGDCLVSINGRPPRDSLEATFLLAESELTLEVRKQDGEPWEIDLDLDEGDDLGLEFEPLRIRRCRNRCVFCFVDQNPKGLRKPLYVRDEDFRYSFLHGNYVTLSHVSDEDLERIVEQRLAPQFISTHTLDPDLRERMLGGRGSRDVGEVIAYLSRHGIETHHQIVLIPGWNDGDELRRTVDGLAAYRPHARSVAVVPVGLTAHRENLPGLRRPTAEEARQLIEWAETWQQESLRKSGKRFLFLGDEFYLMADLAVPPLGEYEELPQLENGVGLVARMVDRIGRLNAIKPARTEPLKLLAITGTAAQPFVQRLADELERVGLGTMIVETADNRLYGQSVTVAGLLGGRDILRAARAGLERMADANSILIPRCSLESTGSRFLDDLTLEELERALGVAVVPVEETLEALHAIVRNQNANS